jgi:hypothetical protein
MPQRTVIAHRYLLKSRSHHLSTARFISPHAAYFAMYSGGLAANDQAQSSRTNRLESLSHSQE